MSAFLGVINLDGKPVDRGYLESMASYLGLIGPDKQSIWTENGAGLVHALLKTSPAKVISQQPLVTQRYAAVGDVRLDGKDELLQSLERRGVAGLEDKQDIELLLQAWLTWGSRAAEHLLGDFSVAIWDRQERKLFCLRDHFGVKQFFYARKGNQFLFSSALNCLRKHPLVSASLNDQAVVDFLVFAFNSDLSTTMFKDIQRLAPAHAMEVSLAGNSLERYWTLPIAPAISYRDPIDYVDRFRELLEQAVSDRLGPESTGVAMSGGLDSTAVAAFAHKFRPEKDYLSLYTLDIADLWPEDREAEHAAVVAQHLGVAHHIYPVTRADLFKREAISGWLLPEPSRDSFWLANMAVFRQMAGRHCTGLTGHGSDPLFVPSAGHYRRLLASGQWLRFIRDASQYYKVHHRRPPLGVRAGLKSTYEKSPWRPALPVWLRPEMVEQSGLADRFAALAGDVLGLGPRLHPERDEAYRDVSSSIWPFTLLRFDPQTTGLPLEFRHPYRDLRLVEFTLAMPASPWFYNKQLLRFASAGVLPDKVRLRKKAMPRVSPVHRGMVALGAIEPGGRLLECEEAARFIDMRHFGKMIESPARLKPDEADQVALPVAFVDWLWMNSL